MRKVVVYELLSLDGVAESPDEFIEWDDVLDDNLGRVIGSQDAVLLGRGTYDEWARFWPGSGIGIEPFAPFINRVDKYVFTSTKPAEEWTNVTVVDGDLAAFVTNLKQQGGGDIGVHGSITLAQGLIEGDLVDELRLVVAPIAQMHGRRLFDRGTAKRFTLTRSVTTPSGYLLLDYAAR